MPRNLSAPERIEQTRRASNREKVLQRLLAGPATNWELVALGGLRAGARIFELRREFDIETVPVSPTVVMYVLHGKKPEVSGQLF